MLTRKHEKNEKYKVGDYLNCQHQWFFVNKFCYIRPNFGEKKKCFSSVSLTNFD
jgi:hypothetical protein